MSEGSVMWRVILVPNGSTAPPDFTCRKDGQDQHQKTSALCRHRLTIANYSLQTQQGQQGPTKNTKSRWEHCAQPS